MFLALLIFLTPITAIGGLSAFGELSSQLTSYLVFASILYYAFVIYQDILKSSPEIKIFLISFVAAIMLSFATSISEISANNEYGRSGYDKFLSAAIVVLFGFFVLLITFRSLRIYRSSDKFGLLLARPMLWATYLNAFVGLFELSSWFIGPITPIYDLLSYYVFHTQHGFIDMPGRLRALGTEPSHLGTFAGFALPWLLAFRKTKPAPYTLAIILVTLIAALSTSRTAYVSLLIVYALYWPLKLLISRNAAMTVTMLFVGALAVNLGALLYVYLGGAAVDQSLTGDGGVSNTTRSATIYAAIDMFLDNPLTGSGLGQGGFGLVKRMPSWAYRSYEISAFENSREGSTAPIFSLPARVAAEMGLAGLAALYGSLTYILYRVLSLRAATKNIDRSADCENATLAVAISMFSIIGVGLSVGSIRLIMIWVTIGCAGYLISYYSAVRRQGMQPTELRNLPAFGE